MAIDHDLPRDVGKGHADSSPNDPSTACTIDNEVSLCLTAMDVTRDQDSRIALIARMEPDAFLTQMCQAFRRIKAYCNKNEKALNLEEFMLIERDESIREYFLNPPSCRAPYRSDGAIDIAVERLCSARRAKAAQKALSDAIHAFDDGDVMDNEARDTAVHQAILALNAARADAGGSTQLTRREEAGEILDRKWGNTATPIYMRKAMGISRQHWRRIEKAEEKQKHPIFRRVGSGRNARIILCRGLGNIKAIDWGEPVDLEATKQVYLPQKMMPYFAEALYKTFFLMAARGDAGKTITLLNIAMANAMMGLSVLFLNHETDDDGIRCLFATLAVGHTVRDIQEAAKICAETDWIGRIRVVSIPEPVNIAELRRYLEQYEYDAICWDYLSPTFLRLDDPVSQGSQFDQLVQTLGVEIVERGGTPLFTAVQQGWGAEDVRPTWFTRSSIGLLCEDVESVGDHSWRTTFRIYKNKKGRIHEYVDILYDRDSLRIQKVETLTKELFRAREARKKKEASARAKEDSEGGGETHSPDGKRAKRDAKLKEKIQPFPKPDSAELAKPGRRSRMR